MLHPRFHVHSKPPAVLALVAALGGQLAAQSPPPLIPYSGVVMDAAGNPLSDPVTLTFAIYADQEGGTPEWDEVQAVQPDWTGRYAVYLGASAAGGLPLDLFTSDSPRWLGVPVEGDIEQPRVLLGSGPMR